MTYIRNNNSYDAFGRLRTSGTGQRLDVEFIYDKQQEFFDEDTNGGSATVTHNTTSRDLTLLNGSTTDGEYACMSSYPIPYTPGNSQLIDMTGVLNFANIAGGTASVFLRSSVTGSVVEEVIEQSNWVNNTSGINWQYAHIFQIDFQSLKVGSIRYSMVQNGIPVQVAKIDNDNEAGTGYWQLPNLPVYYEIYNDATYTYIEIGYGNGDNAVGFRYRIVKNASATMKAICCTVKSEGGHSLKNMEGIPKVIDMGITTATVSTTQIPILSIRPKTTFNGLPNLMIAIAESAYLQADESIRWAIINNGTLTGASWSDVGVNESMMEYDVTATAITGGSEVYADYLYASSSGGKGTIDVGAGLKAGLLGKSVLWDRQGSETGVLSLVAIKSDTTDSEVLGGFRWGEIR